MKSLEHGEDDTAFGSGIDKGTVSVFQGVDPAVHCKFPQNHMTDRIQASLHGGIIP
jgi:hypothetical protein